MKRRRGGTWLVGYPRKRTDRQGIHRMEITHPTYHPDPHRAIDAAHARLRAVMCTPGPHLRAARAGRSRASLARLSGVSARTIGRIERGEVEPKAITLWRLMEALDT
jgi:DNA-binding XRE family transcriptional regulator